VAVVFATQSLADVRQSEIAPALIENCPTRLLLPNPRAMEPDVRAAYAAFGLTEAQLRLLAAAVPKRDYYYQSRSGDRLFDLGLGPLAVGLCGASGHADRALADRLLRDHPRAEFAQRFLTGSGRTAAVERLAAPPAAST
jgi:type IV secretory pathway VirB4 component